MPIQSLSLTLISTWRASSHAWRAMSSLSANGTVLPVVGLLSAPVGPVPGTLLTAKSWHVRPAPSSAWISPTKMPCIRPRAASLASGRDGTRRLLLRFGLAESSAPPVRPTTVRASAIRSRIVILLNRSSRASSSTGK